MIFYRNPNGKDVLHFSYSQWQAMLFCPRKYILEKHYGWIEWPPAASREFGKAVEVGVRAFYSGAGDGLGAALEGHGAARAAAQAAFDAEWAKSKDKQLEYKDREKDWDHLFLIGTHLMILLAAKADGLGIKQPVFYDWKTRMSKAFVGDANLESIPDAIDWPDPHPKFGDAARIDDIKTSGNPYPTEPEGIVAMDEQLRTYSWVTGIQRVAFLVFVKGNPAPAVKKGSEYTLLVDAGGIPAGTEVLCVAGGARACEVVALDAPDGTTAITVLPSELTGCKIQFIEGRVDPLEAQATVETLGAEAELAAKRWELFRASVLPEAGETPVYTKEQALAHAYPQKPGMRFPNDKCTWCPMLGLCLPGQNEQLIKERIIKAEDAWMEEWE